MDKLADLPVSDHKSSPQEQELIQRYLGTPKEEPPSTSTLSKIKTVGIAALLFLLLANPWLDSLLCYVPYCEDNKLLLLLIKVVIFSIVLYLTI